MGNTPIASQHPARPGETPPPHGIARKVPLGPGLGNGLANLHNARKAHVPVVAVVGDHAGYHKRFDAQLESDIESVARNVSPGWVRRSATTRSLGADAADAVAAAVGPPSQVATLILPADVSWSDGGVEAAPRGRAPRRLLDDDTIDSLARGLRSDEPKALLLGGAALSRRGLRAAARVAAATGSQLLAETFPTRTERGAGIVEPTRIAYLGEFAAMQLAPLAQLVLVDASSPVSFFAYPDKESDLVPQGCQVRRLAQPADGVDVVEALERLAEALDAPIEVPVPVGERPGRPTGALTAESLAAAIGATLPEGVIVSDEAQTSGLYLAGATADAPPHSWLCLTGGAIGQGMPLAVGAAMAEPGRPVLNVEADGSALYTLQALWTQAREGLDVTTVICNNRSYSVLNMELARVGVESAGEKARQMLDLHRPDIDFVSMSEGLGVPAVRVDTAEDLTRELERCYAEPGPRLIEAVVPPLL
ncbi:MAG: acetolactate synthase large subunit [Acidimicrobiia bacterium]|nr:acetolactate synthase large subunit [Acidimicrobiia bacterium]